MTPGWALVALFAAWIVLWRRVHQEKFEHKGRVIIIVDGEEI